MDKAVHLLAGNVKFLIGKSPGTWLLLLSFLFPFFTKAQLAEPKPSCRIDFIADTQAPLWIEYLIRESNRNVEATRILMNDIRIQKPSALYFLGDVVNLSRSNNHWQFMDSCLASFHADGLPTYACLGNHELMGNAKEGEKNFQVRFPDHVNTGYVVRIDSIAMIFLNSNFSKMSTGQILKQDEWYQKEIAALDLDPAIRVIIVGCHHPPYSDSEVVGSSDPVRKKFLPAFSQSSKCRLFITGHAHMFQHFQLKGKDILVIGGGGGLGHSLAKKSCGLEDLAGKYKPPFHYVTLYRYPGHLKIISKRLKEDFSAVEEGLTFDIPVEN